MSLRGEPGSVSGAQRSGVCEKLRKLKAAILPALSKPMPAATHTFILRPAAVLLALGLAAAPAGRPRPAARPPPRAPGGGHTRQALACWRELGASGESRVAAEAVLALRRDNERAARKHLAELLRSPDEGWRQALGVLLAGARDPDQAGRVLEALGDGRHIPQNLQAWVAFGGAGQRLDRPQLAQTL